MAKNVYKKRKAAEVVEILNTSNVLITRENNRIFFDISSKKFGNIVTQNYIEAVSIMTRDKDFNRNRELWNLEILSEMKTTKFIKTTYYNIIYWLTGGDTEWGNDTFVSDFGSLCDVFLNNYKEYITSITKDNNIYLMSDVKNMIKKRMSIAHIYDFSIKNNLILEKNVV